MIVSVNPKKKPIGAESVPISLSDLSSSFTIKEWIKKYIDKEAEYSNTQIKGALDTIIKNDSFNERSEETRRQFYSAINALKQKLSETEK